MSSGFDRFQGESKIHDRGVAILAARGVRLADATAEQLMAAYQQAIGEGVTDAPPAEETLSAKQLREVATLRVAHEIVAARGIPLQEALIQADGRLRDDPAAVSAVLGSRAGAAAYVLGLGSRRGAA